MNRCSILLIILCALLAGCNSPRRACRKAERHLARAIWLCPEVLGRDSVHLTVTTKGDSAAGALSYSQADIDSMLAACDSLKQGAERVSAPTIERAVKVVRRSACRPVPVHVATSQLLLDIWVDTLDGTLRYKARVLPQVIPVDAPCPPAVTRPLPTTGGIMRDVLISCGLLLFILVIVLILKRARKRAHDRPDSAA